MGICSLPCKTKVLKDLISLKDLIKSHDFLELGKQFGLFGGEPDSLQ